MDNMICKKDLVLFLFPHKTLCFGYLLDGLTEAILSEATLMNTQNICCLSFNEIFLDNFSTVTS